MSIRSEEIRQAVTDLFIEHGIEDTPETRYWAYKGLQEAWSEDETVSFEKTMYRLALNGEIMKAMTQIQFAT